MAVLALLESVGRGATTGLGALGKMGGFGADVTRWLFARSPFLAEVLRQAVRVGVQSLLVIATINFFVGANVALVGHAIFRQFGGQNLLGIYVGLSVIVGMAPIILGAMLAAKPGTEIAATIASMRVKEQLDALEVMAVNPYWYLIVPRLLAFLLVTPPLTVFAYAAGVAGGYATATLQLGVNPGLFLTDVVRFLAVKDLVNGIVRAEIFSVVICLMCCFFGYHAKPGPAGVSRAINLSVVFGSVTIIVINYFLTEFMY